MREEPNRLVAVQRRLPIRTRNELETRGRPAKISAEDNSQKSARIQEHAAISREQKLAGAADLVGGE
jgi:hypothetical protein